MNNNSPQTELVAASHLMNTGFIESQTLLLPQDIDRLTRQRGDTLREIRKAIPAACYQIDERRSLLSMARAILTSCGLLFLLTQLPLSPGWELVWQIPLLLMVWFIFALSLVGLFVLGHDCGHHAFSKKRWLNYLVGHIAMSPFMLGFHNWRIAHNHHHAFTQMRHNDTDWPEQMVTQAEYQAQPWHKKLHSRLGLATPIGLLVAFWVSTGRRLLIHKLFPQIRLNQLFRRQLRFSNAITLVCSTLAISAIFYWGGSWVFCKYYLIPICIGNTVGSLFTMLHHTNADSLVFEKADWTPVRGQLVSTFEVRFPWWIEYLCFDINIHLPHHLAPQIPWYHLKEASQALKQAYPEYHQERSFRWSDLQLFWANPLLEHHQTAGYFTMAPLEPQS